MYSGVRVISYLLHKSKAELRKSVMTIILSEYTRYSYFISQRVGVCDNHEGLWITN